ncbi:MAG: hypothetical protein H6608_11785 [Flavobacteriales bacterium]|nr:hypothetical protein [Bacteroidota bacterium]MCB9241809.1 hypothetical protein [Flavobacteriales bacterium]
MLANRRTAHIYFYLFWIIVLIRIILFITQPAPLDGVWQLSGHWSLTRGVFFFNEYTQHHFEHFHTINIVLWPLLKILGAEPVQWFYSLIFLINAFLLYRIFEKSSNPLHAILSIIVVSSSLFFLGRLEDVFLLISLMVVYRSINFQLHNAYLVVVTAMSPLIHPVCAGGMLGVLIALRMANRISFNQLMLGCSVTLLVGLSLFLPNFHAYSHQISYRISGEHSGLISSPFTLSGILLLFAVWMLTKKKRTYWWLLGCFTLVLLALSKPFYLATLIPILLIIPLKDDLLAFQRALLVILATIFIFVQTINPLFQRFENPSHITDYFHLKKELIDFVPTGAHTFVEPTFAQGLLESPDTRNVLIDHKRFIIYWSDTVKPGDQIIVVGSGKVATLVQKYQETAFSIDTLSANRIGILSLNSLYQRRANDLTLYCLTSRQRIEPIIKP